MIRTLIPLKIAFKNNVSEKYKPKNMTQGKVYQVVAEQVKIRERNDNGKVLKIEEIHFGYIGDDLQLSFIASYNCVCGELENTDIERYLSEPAQF